MNNIGCDKGRFASGTGTVSDCPQGTYQDLVGQTSCKPCSAGKYGSETKATTESKCIKCPPNTYSSATGLNSERKCNNCPAGRSSTTAGLTSADDCTGITLHIY